VQVRDLSSVPLWAPAGSIAGNGVGTAGAVHLPKQTCGLISYVDGLSGRAHRGRMYVPFPSSADNVADGVPTVGYVVNLGALLTALLVPIIVVGAGGNTTIQPGLYHRAKVGPPPVPQSITILSGPPTPSTLWATQRRRGDYGRPNRAPLL
jgi:hypothetical protein